ncbi:NUDIX hydrolase [Corynebacterium sp. Q4381]|uniref:NUDIX hydrolase n=1 Tax=Corynebacterium sp. Marseille-Q4381 TaxID=3121597 RepID=UPI002FE53AB8
MLGDGNGWVHHNHTKYWGLHGAAGLFLVAGGRALMQHRAAWTAQGGTWGIPGGARDSHESASEAALRETVEECAIDVSEVTVTGELVTFSVPGWSYTTVLARADRPLRVTANEESEELRWVPLDEIAALPLHPGFAASLPALVQAVVHTEPHD